MAGGVPNIDGVFLGGLPEEVTFDWSLAEQEPVSKRSQGSPQGHRSQGGNRTGVPKEMGQSIRVGEERPGEVRPQWRVTMVT